MSCLHHKEGRYIIPLLPFAYIFIGRAMEGLPRRWMKAKKRFFIKGMVILASMSALYTTTCEGLVLSHSHYRNPFVENVALHIKELGPKKHLVHLRNFCALYPLDYPKWYYASKYDEVYHFYHQAPFMYQYLSGVVVHATQRGGFIDETIPGHPFIPQVLYHFPENSVFLYGSPQFENSGSKRLKPSPLLIATLEREKFRRDEKGLSSENFSLKKVGTKWKVERGPFPFELYLKKKEGYQSMGVIREADFIWVVSSGVEKKRPLAQVLEKLKGEEVIWGVYQKVKAFSRVSVGE